jgi:ubiquinone/menaquinone biosynthesis C-methylase UbiE
MTTGRRPLVDYDANAERYRRGRDLSTAQHERWRAVVADRLPEGPLSLVVDAGAGTGAFLPMWEALGARRILAVEPSAAMRAAAAGRATAIAAARIVAGTLDALPAASGTADVVWVSTVLHHVVDRHGAFREIARVLRPRGRLLLRGFLPGSSRVPWLDHFPGAERATARFPSLQDVHDLAERAGLRIVDDATVPEALRVHPAQAIAWITQMRNADSLLTALTDDEIARGIAALGELADEPLAPVALDLVTLELRSSHR